MITNLYQKTARFLCCVLLVLSAQSYSSAQAATNNTVRKNAPLNEAEIQKWREDLHYMAQKMPLFHNNLFHTMRREQFEAAIKRLDERIPMLARHQIIVEMQRIAAMVGDGHTNVYPTRDAKIGFRQLPVKMYFFKDGLFIRAATEVHAEIVGARVVKIGSASVEQAYDAARELIGRDNEMGAKFFAPHLLAIPEILHALGLIDDMENARFTVEKGGKQKIVELKPAGLTDLMAGDTDKSWMPKPGWIDARAGAPISNHHWLKDPENKFWYEYLPDKKTVYVQFNEVGNKKDETLAAFSKRLFDFVDANPVEKLILDLRLNRGGNGELNRPFLLNIIKANKINQKGKLFAIIGRSTFSAAQFLVNDLEKFTNTIFVGEPTGSKGNHYGDSRRIYLPNSGITVRVSVYYWQAWHPTDSRFWTPPDLTAELAFEDYRLNSDPALKMILDYAPRKSLRETLDEAITQGGVDLAVKRFQEFTADPVNRYVSVDLPLREAGQRLLDEKKPEQAAILFEVNTARNPYSFQAYFAVGEAYLKAGKIDLARKNFEKSLQINPKNYDVITRMEELKRKKQ
ncbi:MAG TPA: tetratricopeptide repeat protein [Pyrinomonadaceae bacterium]|jgi:tetratricopeptide (TPR) repeat protein